MELIGTIVLAAAVFFALQKLRGSSLPRKGGTKSKKIYSGPHDNWGLTDPKNQLEAISKVNFEKVRLLNKSEFRVFQVLERIVQDIDSGHRVMAQTSLGELIKPSSKSGDWKARKNAFASINSKRLDFAVVDKYGMLAIAVEYQGSGHHHKTTFMRDAVKREALRRAGVPFLEVEKGMMPNELKAEVTKALLPIGRT